MKKQKGITLIALIITIIVILILVAVSVRTISKSGLFDHAKDATNKWANEQNKEANIGEGIGNIVEQYTPIDPSKPTNPEYFTYIVDEETKTATLTGVKEEYAMRSIYAHNGNGYLIGIQDGDKIITEVVIPSEVTIADKKYTVTRIQEGCFEAYSLAAYESLFELFIIPDTIKVIDKRTFNGCAKVKKVVLPNGISAIGDSAFSSCTSLTSINIPNSVTNIGRSAFSSCTSLTSINIPNSVTNIGSFAFYSCTSLTNINIPNSVTSIGEMVFGYWTSSQTINCQATEKPSGWYERWNDYSYSTPCKATVNWGVSM